MCIPQLNLPPKYIVLFKGDDSDFDGNQEIAIDIDTQLSLEGVKAHFRFLDFSQDFDAIPEDRRLLLVFPRESTRKFPLGAMDATLTFEDAQGRTRTVANRIHIVVTNSIREAYWNEDPQAITVVMSGDEYLKNAKVSEDGKTLTLTKKDGTEVQFRGGGGGGTDDYNDLDNKPRINGHELSGNTSLDDINAQEKLDYNPSTGRYEIEVVEAQHAESAGDAQSAINDILGNNINQTYARKDQSYTRAEIDDKINRFSAHYLTSDSAGHPFATDTALNAAQKFYYAGEEFTPTKNDYCVVMTDSGHSGKTTRYSFVGEWGQGGSWQYQYTINDTAFSQAQWAAINSGATAEKIEEIDSKADEFTPWVTDPSFPLKWTGNGWVVVVDGEIASFERGDIDSIDITWDMGQWMGNVPLHATRKRVLRTGDADKLTDAQKAVLAGAPYMGSHGGEFIDGEFSLTAGRGGGLVLKGEDSGDGLAQFGSNSARGVSIFGSSFSDIPSSIKKDGKEVATEDQVDLKADKLTNTVVAKIDEEQHDDNIMVRIMRVPIEFARKAFNAVRMSFHQDNRDEAAFMAIGYSTGNGGASGVTYDNIVVELSSDYFFKDESGSHIYNFSQNVTSKIPSDAKFLTFFFFDDSEMEISGTAPIETGYATTEEEQQKKYQIQQSAEVFFVDHAPLIDFLVIDDPVARESILSGDKFKSAVESIFDNGETEVF